MFNYMLKQVRKPRTNYNILKSMIESITEVKSHWTDEENILFEVTFPNGITVHISGYYSERKGSDGYRSRVYTFEMQLAYDYQTVKVFTEEALILTHARDLCFKEFCKHFSIIVDWDGDLNYTPRRLQSNPIYDEVVEAMFS